MKQESRYGVGGGGCGVGGARESRRGVRLRLGTCAPAPHHTSSLNTFDCLPTNPSGCPTGTESTRGRYAREGRRSGSTQRGVDRGSVLWLLRHRSAKSDLRLVVGTPPFSCGQRPSDQAGSKRGGRPAFTPWSPRTSLSTSHIQRFNSPSESLLYNFGQLTV